jgi:regulation of enolase protein 1 (concanavalin A-like superfamily)
MSEKSARGGAVLLDESFDAPRFDTRLRWLNPPPAADLRDGWLAVAPGDKSDFWQKTVTGESHDNGHLLYLELSGDFVAETKVSGEFQNRYDHAGLMLRQDATHWLKTSAENDPVGAPHLGVVITRGTSDWSVSRPAPQEYILRLTRRGDLVEVHTSLDGHEWALLRQAVLPLKDPVKVGIFAACPVKDGFRVRFNYLRITRPPEQAPAAP